MPLPLIAHQAVVLPLKLVRREVFSGTALCVGSLVPDLEYLIGPRAPGLLHRWSGMLVTVPVTVVLTLFLSGIMSPVVSCRLPSAFRGTVAAMNGPISLRTLPTIASSAVIGAASHLVLDGLTHHDGWAVHLFPALARPVGAFARGVTGLLLMQYVASGVLTLLGVFIFACVMRSEPRRSVRPVVEGRTALLLGSLGGAVLAFASARRVMQRATDYFVLPKLHLAGYLSFVAFCGAALGLALVSVFLLAHDRTRAPRSPARDAST